MISIKVSRKELLDPNPSVSSCDGDGLVYSCMELTSNGYVDTDFESKCDFCLPNGNRSCEGSHSSQFNIPNDPVDIECYCMCNDITSAINISYGHGSSVLLSSKSETFATGSYVTTGSLLTVNPSSSNYLMLVYVIGMFQVFLRRSCYFYLDPARSGDIMNLTEWGSDGRECISKGIRFSECNTSMYTKCFNRHCSGDDPLSLCPERVRDTSCPDVGVSINSRRSNGVVGVVKVENPIDDSRCNGVVRVSSRSKVFNYDFGPGNSSFSLNSNVQSEFKTEVFDSHGTLRSSAVTKVSDCSDTTDPLLISACASNKLGARNGKILVALMVFSIIVFTFLLISILINFPWVGPHIKTCLTFGLFAVVGLSIYGLRVVEFFSTLPTNVRYLMNSYRRNPFGVYIHTISKFRNNLVSCCLGSKAISIKDKPISRSRAAMILIGMWLFMPVAVVGSSTNSTGLDLVLPPAVYLPISLFFVLICCCKCRLPCHFIFLLFVAIPYCNGCVSSHIVGGQVTTSLDGEKFVEFVGDGKLPGVGSSLCLGIKSDHSGIVISNISVVLKEVFIEWGLSEMYSTGSRFVEYNCGDRCPRVGQRWNECDDCKSDRNTCGGEISDLSSMNAAYTFSDCWICHSKGCFFPRGKKCYLGYGVKLVTQSRIYKLNVAKVQGVLDVKVGSESSSFSVDLTKPNSVKPIFSAYDVRFYNHGSSLTDIRPYKDYAMCTSKECYFVVPNEPGDLSPGLGEIQCSNWANCRVGGHVVTIHKRQDPGDLGRCDDWVTIADDPVATIIKNDHDNINGYLGGRSYSHASVDGIKVVRTTISVGPTIDVGIRGRVLDVERILHFPSPVCGLIRFSSGCVGAEGASVFWNIYSSTTSGLVTLTLSGSNATLITEFIRLETDPSSEVEIRFLTALSTFSFSLRAESNNMISCESSVEGGLERCVPDNVIPEETESDGNILVSNPGLAWYWILVIVIASLVVLGLIALFVSRFGICCCCSRCRSSKSSDSVEYPEQTYVSSRSKSKYSRFTNN